MTVLDLLAQLATMTDNQGDHKTPQGLQEAPGADEATQGDHLDAVVAWRGFSGDTTDDEARRLFVARLLAGPL